MDEDKISENNNNEYYEIGNIDGKKICIGSFELPEDLVTQILLKLPVKSLIRFKIVCKPWKLLIESSVFINNHLHRENPLHNCFRLDSLKKNPFPFHIYFSVGSCNGIICFNTTNPQTPLVLFNPSTREFSFLPKECRGDFYGFCYLSQTQEYKVICFKWQNCKPPLKDSPCRVDMMILTLGAKPRSSRDVEDVTLPGKIQKYAPGRPNQATSGGTIVWLGYDYKGTTIVICYDVLEDRFSKMDLPPSYLDPDEEDTTYSLAVFRESVILFLHSDYFIHTSFDIWILVTEDESNVKSWHHHVKVPERWQKIKPLNACRDDRWVLCSKDGNDFGEHWSDKLFYYDLETNEIEDYKTEKKQAVTQFVNYVESLVSPKNICSSLMY